MVKSVSSPSSSSSSLDSSSKTSFSNIENCPSGTERSKIKKKHQVQRGGYNIYKDWKKLFCILQNNLPGSNPQPQKMVPLISILFLFSNSSSSKPLPELSTVHSSIFPQYAFSSLFDNPGPSLYWFCGREVHEREPFMHVVMDTEWTWITSFSNCKNPKKPCS